MKKSIIPLIIATSLLVACNDKEYNELSNKLKQNEILVAQLQNEIQQLKQETTLAPSLQVKITPLFDKNKTIKFKDNEFISEGNINVSGDIPETNIEWLNKLLIEKAYTSNVSDRNTPKVSTNEITKQRLIQLFEDMYSNFAKEIEEQQPSELSYQNVFEYLGQRNNIVSFSNSTYEYYGGAHGMHYIDFFNIDIDKKKIISIDDVITKENQDKLKEILWQNYIDEHGDENKTTFTSKEDFSLSDSFYFTHNGIAFVYPPYVLGPYVEGDITLTADWYSLNKSNLVNSEYKW